MPQPSHKPKNLTDSSQFPQEFGDEERRHYERWWRASPEGELFKREVRNYEFAVSPDGSFRVDDVLPGSYRLQVRADIPVTGAKGVRQAAVAEIDVDVPEMPGGRSDELLDLGTLHPGVTVR